MPRKSIKSAAAAPTGILALIAQTAPEAAPEAAPDTVTLRSIGLRWAKETHARLTTSGVSRETLPPVSETAADLTGMLVTQARETLLALAQALTDAAGSVDASAIKVKSADKRNVGRVGKASVTVSLGAEAGRWAQASVSLTPAGLAGITLGAVAPAPAAKKAPAAE